MSLDATGFNARRFTDIRDSIFTEMVNNLAIQLDTSPNQILSIITNIFASSVTDVEELAQAVADNFNIDKAEGKYLDDLVALVKIRRLDEGFSTGILHIKSNAVSSVININTSFLDSQGNTYVTTVPTDVSNLSCTEATIVPTVSQGTFSVTIDGTTFSSNFQNSTPVLAIVTSLRNAILASAPTEYTAEVFNSNSLRITKVEKSTPFSVTTNASLSVDSVEVFTRIRAVTAGAIDPEINSITIPATTITGLLSVTNYFRMTVGRNKETDEELRARHSSSTQISGSATASAIFSKLSNIVGVSQVRVFENKTFQTNSSGLPPKSFECIVQGGDESTISQTIYNTMPVGVETFGNITSIVKDYAGNNEAVKWSRPSQVYINVRVTYSLYDEESFPDDGVNAIKQAVVNYGDSLSLDEDVIPQRFLGAIYSNVSGIGTMTVEVGTSVNPSSTTPDDIPYTTNRLPIDARSIPDFDVIRVQVVQA